MVAKLIIGGWVLASVKSDCLAGLDGVAVDEDGNVFDPYNQHFRPEVIYEILKPQSCDMGLDA